MSNYYVYVYIDPRNHEEFYYGKGKGSRKDAHLHDTGDSEKVQRIRAIQKEGQKPIIRVIASRLTESEAYLIETTLIWKLGRTLINESSGRYTSKFRPHNTLHRKLHGFDYQNRIYYFNVGEGPHRVWEDCVDFGFISAGQGKKRRDQINAFHRGDIIVAYLKKHGYVGIARVIESAIMIRDCKVGDKRLLDCPLRCQGMKENSDDVEKSEYVALVEWIRTVDRSQAKWKPKSNLYTTPLIRASLEKQPKTIEFIEQKFTVNLRNLII